MKMLLTETAIFESVVLSYLRRECESKKKKKRKSKSHLSTDADGGNVGQNVSYILSRRASSK